jgi:hypothetical protein
MTVDADTARARLSVVAGIRYFDHGDEPRRACLCAWGEVDGARTSIGADGSTFDIAVVRLYEECLAFDALVTENGHRYRFDKRAEEWRRRPSR